MTIALEELKSRFTLDTNGLNVGALAATAAIGAVVAAMGVAVKATFDWANDLDSLGDVIGGTNEQLAAFNFVARKSGVDIDKFAKGNTIMEKGLLKTDGTLDSVGKKLKEFGINVKDSNGVVKDQVRLTDEIAKKYASLATQQEKVNFLTEVYGKSGAELVDFFDVLAQEGGIDRVTEKVKALGLAIDPARYEQFNRNLEELKLVGLGLAVSFTEKVMPALEGVLNILADPNLTTSEKIGTLIRNIDDFVGTAIDSFAQSIENWAAGDGPQILADKLVAWIENVGKGGTFNSKIFSAVGRLVSAIGTAIGQVDWGSVQIALEDRITEMFDASRPRGQDAFADWWDALEVTGTDAMRNFWNNLEVKGTDAVRNFFNGLEAAGTAATRRWGEAVYNEIVEWVNRIISALNRIPQVSLPSLPTVGTTGSGNRNRGRATGGSVMAGQSYNVAEFYKPEVFTPNTGGRIDALKPQMVAIDENRMATVFGRVLGEQLAKHPAGA